MSEATFKLEKYIEVGTAVQPHCYITNRPEVDAVCYHCGRPISLSRQPSKKVNRHRWKLIRREEGKEKEGSRVWNKIVSYLQKLALVKSQEFTDLNLKPDVAVHCEYCDHSGGFLRMLWLSLMIIFFVLTIVAFQQPTVVETELNLPFLFGVISAGFILIELFYRINRTPIQPPFPLMGRATSVKVEEFLTGYVALLGDGQYRARTDLDSCHGQISYTLLVTADDKERLKKYWKKYEPPNETFQFLAGFLLFQNARALKFGNSHHLMNDRINTLRIRGGDNRETWLSRSDAREWTTQSSYKIGLDVEKEIDTVSVQIFPTILSEGGRTALLLTVQANPKVRNKALRQAKVTLKELRLTAVADTHVGNVESANPAKTTGPQLNEVCWKGVPLETPSDDNVDKQFGEEHREQVGKSAPTANLYVRFESNVKPEMVFQGRLIVTFDDTFSGIGEVQLFDPLGDKQDPKKEYTLKCETKVTVDFELDLNSLCVRESYSPPVEPIDKVCLIPNYRLVNELVTSLSSDARTYVQRVVENPPETNAANAKIINRFWDIAGRQYTGVYPIDFHIILSGHEIYTTKDRPDCGETTFEIKINATTTNEEMKAEVKAVRARLCAIVALAYQKLKEDKCPIHDHRHNSSP